MVNCDLHGHLVPINGPLVKKPLSLFELFVFVCVTTIEKDF